MIQKTDLGDSIGHYLRKKSIQMKKVCESKFYQ